MPSSPATGTLYVVATPIGNLEDITLRALRILKEADLIVSEDTRHTRKLLTHFGINTPLASYYREKEQEKSEKLVARLLSGVNIALVSDAGTPAVSDPGAILVHKARAHGVPVVPVPGPSALTAALSVAGIGSGAFLFLGFLPARRKERRDLLHSLAAAPQHLVFFESPHRLAASLADCLAALGDRPVFWGRELTKLHEELLDTRLAALEEEVRGRSSIKGESVLVVHGADRVELPEVRDVGELLLWFKERGGTSLKDAVRQVSGELDLPRSEVYRRALDVWSGEEDDEG